MKSPIMVPSLSSAIVPSMIGSLPVHGLTITASKILGTIEIESMAHLLEAATKKITGIVALDFSNVRYVDSGIAIKLKKVADALKSRGGELHIVGCNEAIDDLFHMVDLNKIIPISRKPLLEWVREAFGSNSEKSARPAVGDGTFSADPRNSAAGRGNRSPAS